jgi:hypothetical protein
MHKRSAVVLVVSLWLAASGFAKEKKSILPAYVLTARTVAVRIDPSAGVSLDNPEANTVAQRDVESALLSWGRFQLVPGTGDADLIILVRKGSGRFVNQTVTNPRQNRRPNDVDSSDDGVILGGQHGQQPSLSGDPGNPNGQSSPHAQTEIGEGDDSFTVYEGGVEHPLDNSPAWRYVAKDGLRPHTVPAVAEFRKALVEADKAAAKKP